MRCKSPNCFCRSFQSMRSCFFIASELETSLEVKVSLYIYYLLLLIIRVLINERTKVHINMRNTLRIMCMYVQIANNTERRYMIIYVDNSLLLLVWYYILQVIHGDILVIVWWYKIQLAVRVQNINGTIWVHLFNINCNFFWIWEFCI